LSWDSGEREGRREWEGESETMWWKTERFGDYNHEQQLDTHIHNCKERRGGWLHSWILNVVAAVNEGYNHVFLLKLYLRLLQCVYCGVVAGACLVTLSRIRCLGRGLINPSYEHARSVIDIVATFLGGLSYVMPV